MRRFLWGLSFYWCAFESHATDSFGLTQGEEIAIVDEAQTERNNRIKPRDDPFIFGLTEKCKLQTILPLW